MIPLLLALACVPVDGPKLLGRHLASAVEAFSALAPETEIGYAPAPGVVRVIRTEELQRLASKHGIALTPLTADVCFDWSMRPLDSASVVDAMRKGLPPDASIEVLELSRTPVPEGALEFPLSSLQGTLWRGSVQYSQSGRFEVWARVRVRVKQARLIMSSAVRAGEAISASNVRVEQIEEAPVADLVSSLEDAVGKMAKRPLPVGAVLKSQYLDEPSAVAKGDTVRLHASVGEAHVVTEASAQAPGKVGDVIPVKNATSGRVLRARIEAPGQVRLTQ